MSSTIKIQVQNPMTHVTAEGKFTSYLIVLQTENLAFSLKSSNIRRRYSEFVWLRDILSKNHPDITPPPLPKKTFFKDRFDTELVEGRKTGLDMFLKRLVQETRYLSDNAVHLFLQSPLSVVEIQTHLANPRGQTTSALVLAHQQEALGICPDCERENAAVTPPSSLPGVAPPATTPPTPCPHDIFSPTRPHSFDFSHCVMGGRSASIDSADDGHLGNTAGPRELEQVTQ